MTDENVTLLTQARTHLIRCLRRQLAAHDTWKSARDLASRFGGPFVRHERDANTELAAAKDSADLAETAYRRAERALCSWTILPLMLLALLTGTAHAYTFAENTDGQEARWATEEIAIRVDPQLGAVLGKPQVSDALNIASDAWRGLQGVPTLKVSEWPAAPFSEFTDENSVVYGYGYAFDGELAVTLLRFNEAGQIRKAVVALNPEYMDAFKAGKFDLASVLTHEFGHVLGLNHSEHPDAVMGQRLNPGTTKQRLTEDDEQGIEALYELHPRIAGGCSAAGESTDVKWWHIFWGGVLVSWIWRLRRSRRIVSR